MSRARRRRIRKLRRKARQARPQTRGVAGRHMLQTGRTGAVHSKRLATRKAKS